MKATSTRTLWVQRLSPRGGWLLTSVFFLLFACGAGSARIGAILGKDRHDGRLYVRTLAPGQSAEKAGLQSDDEVLAIDGKDVRPMTNEEVSTALRGKVGSKVTLTIKRDGTQRDVNVERGAE